MEKVENRTVYLACLEEGDEINFVTNVKEPRTALEQYMFDHSAGMLTGTFKGWFDDKCERMMVKVGSKTGDIEGTIQSETTDFYVESEVAEDAFIASRVDGVNERFSVLIRKGMEVIDALGTIIDFQDADTVLADIHDNTETNISGVALRVLDIWEKSIDRMSVEALFETLYGVTFTEWLIDGAKATLDTVREAQKGKY